MQHSAFTVLSLNFKCAMARASWRLAKQTIFAASGCAGSCQEGSRSMMGPVSSPTLLACDRKPFGLQIAQEQPSIEFHACTAQLDCT